MMQFSTEDQEQTQAFHETRIGASMQELKVKSDEELADWQSQQVIGSARHILAEKEWERRLAEKTINATKNAMWVTATSTLAAAVIGGALGFWAKCLTG